MQAHPDSSNVSFSSKYNCIASPRIPELNISHLIIKYYTIFNAYNLRICVRYFGSTARDAEAPWKRQHKYSQALALDFARSEIIQCRQPFKHC